MLEDPHIHDPALGEPDTTTRVKTIWQVKFLPVQVAQSKPRLGSSMPDNHVASGGPCLCDTAFHFQLAEAKAVPSRLSSTVGIRSPIRIVIRLSIWIEHGDAPCSLSQTRSWRVGSQLLNHIRGLDYWPGIVPGILAARQAHGCSRTVLLPGNVPVTSDVTER